MKTVSHVSGKIDCDGVKKGRGGEERRGGQSWTGGLLCSRDISLTHSKQRVPCGHFTEYHF